MQKINGKTKLTGILGWPVEHSFSPLMHNAAYEELKLNYAYLPFCVKPGELLAAVRGVKALNLAGVNVTVPHKEKVVKYLDEVDNTALKVGAVNTIVNRNGWLKGYNTDVSGFGLSLKNKKIPLTNKNVLVMGAGGAAKAVVAYLRSYKTKLYIADIDSAKASSLANTVGANYIDIKRANEVLLIADLLINATPIGMCENKKPIELAGCKKNLFVYDLIYNRKTSLLVDAEKLGLQFSDGIEMLLFQGCEAFKLFTGKTAPVAFMKKVLTLALSCK